MLCRPSRYASAVWALLLMVGTAEPHLHLSSPSLPISPCHPSTSACSAGGNNAIATQRATGGGRRASMIRAPDRVMGLSTCDLDLEALAKVHSGVLHDGSPGTQHEHVCT